MEFTPIAATHSYDNIGNPLSYRDGMSFTWEHGRQMKTFTNSEGSTWEYTYDDSGYRTKKKLLNTTYEYMLDGSQVVCMKTPTNTVWFYYDATGQRVAMDIGGTVYYYMYNLMGDVLGLYDGAGNVVARYAYDAWGKILSIKDGSGNLLNPTSNPLAPGIINPFRYRGYMYDTESGLYYLNSRYYDPETGRFVNADGYVSTGQGLLGHNMYAYCLNNPVMMIDPTGTACHINDFGRAGAKCPFINGKCLIHGTNACCIHIFWEEPSSPSVTSSYLNKDGSHSLYDNRRHDPENIFHEQVLSIKVSEPAFDLKKQKVSLGSVTASLLTGGWEWENIDLSLLDFGTAKLSAGFEENTLDISAMASIWTPSVSVKLWDVNVTLSAHVGSIGGKAIFGSNGFDVAGASGWGVGISVAW